MEAEDKQGKKEGGFLWKGFPSLWLVVFFVCGFPFETGSHYVALDGQEITIETRLALNSQSSTCLCLLSVEITGMHHHAQLWTGALVSVAGMAIH